MVLGQEDGDDQHDSADANAPGYSPSASLLLKLVVEDLQQLVVHAMEVVKSNFPSSGGLGCLARNTRGASFGGRCLHTGRGN